MDTSLADGIKRIGFRKWYERQLLSSHVHMVLAFLSVVALIGAMEAFRGSDHDAQFVNVLFVIVCAAIGAWSTRRYVYLLMRAEKTANQANCPDCGTYGRFHIVGEHPRSGEIEVRCDKCAHDWVIFSAAQ